MTPEIKYTTNNQYFKSEFVGNSQSADPDRFWVCTYTEESYSVGKNEAAYLNPPAELHGRPVLAMPRGGQWTWHGPGQVALFMDINCARLLQEAKPRATQIMRIGHTINTEITKILSTLCRIECWFNDKDPGIYSAEGAKLASLGWDNISDTNILYNWSFNINIANAFAGFGKIDVCGVKNRPMANLMPDCGNWQELQYRQFGSIVANRLIAELYKNTDILKR